MPGHCCSVWFSRSVVSDSLQPHGLQYVKPPCPSPTPGVYLNESIESVMPSNHRILCCPLLLLSIFPSIRVFSNESVLWIRWPKYWNFSFSISPSNENSGLIFFRMELLDLLAVWGRHYLHYLHHSLAGGQIIGREHNPAHQQKIGLKIYWVWPRPSEQDLVSPSVSLHQEASISLLFSSIRGQTEWKPQSQKTNQTDHMDHGLV